MLLFSSRPNTEKKINLNLALFLCEWIGTDGHATATLAHPSSAEINQFRMDTFRIIWYREADEPHRRRHSKINLIKLLLPKINYVSIKKCETAIIPTNLYNRHTNTHKLNQRNRHQSSIVVTDSETIFIGPVGLRIQILNLNEWSIVTSWQRLLDSLFMFGWPNKLTSVGETTAAKLAKLQCFRVAFDASNGKQKHTNKESAYLFN